ncbi:MAG: MFS transporter [Burkholderiales bacterium]|nr:MFS transporter [Burkholderiales bacterium]
MNALARSLSGRLHYAWIVAGLVFVLLLCAAGVRSAPGVLIVPLEHSLGWDRATISAAIAVHLVLLGAMGPFAGATMLRFGVRRTVLAALALLAIGIGASTQMTQPWHLMLTWGLMVGIGSGLAATVLAATVVNRWFTERRGLVMGLLTAASAMGQLVFLPLLALISEAAGWRAVAWTVAAVMACLVPIIAWLMVERPRDLGLRSYGAAPGEIEAGQMASGNPVGIAWRSLQRALPTRDFWLLAGTFFVCGLSTNGLIGTHFIAFCFDGGLPEVRAAGILAMMGMFNLVGTALSGWLSDRYDCRWLLFWYYGLRGLSLLYLPYSDLSWWGLGLFAVFYGLDWIATVPPTLRITTDVFGRRDAAVVFGWIFMCHQLGAGIAAFGGGAVRNAFGAYTGAFLVAGLACAVAALAVLAIQRGGRRPAPAAA